jgi:tRNA (Thr-GGU) A37 N-methylase
MSQPRVTTCSNLDMANPSPVLDISAMVNSLSQKQDVKEKTY